MNTVCKPCRCIQPLCGLFFLLAVYYNKSDRSPNALVLIIHGLLVSLRKLLEPPSCRFTVGIEVVSKLFGEYFFFGHYLKYGDGEEQHRHRNQSRIAL